MKTLESSTKPRKPWPRFPRTFPLRWRGYDRAAVDQCLRQLAGSYERLHARLTFLEELIGNWHEQGIDLGKPPEPEPTSGIARRIPLPELPARGEPRADRPAASGSAERVDRRKHSAFLGFEMVPQPRSVVIWRRVAIVIGLAVLAALLYSRHSSHAESLSSSMSPFVAAEPVSRAAAGRVAASFGARVAPASGAASRQAARASARLTV